MMYFGIYGIQDHKHLLFIDQGQTRYEILMKETVGQDFMKWTASMKVDFKL
jgi:hypothetical protein